ncbi:MAG: carboxypeptidase regulatory-like domain-containing protein [Planctomycetaceae bacterium]|nr:carboxypeptidase regulatory-like domain-containing protein [Planctomycetaceae bacterium]
MRAIFSVGMLMVAAGCGGGDTPALLQVTGQVLRGGAPVPGALVEFIPDAGRPSLGQTGPDGRFVMNYTTNAEGVLPGQHRVVINAPDTPPVVIDPESMTEATAAVETQQQRRKQKVVEPLVQWPDQILVSEDGQDFLFNLDRI